MVVGIGKVCLYAGWVNSLKEKRSVVKSIKDKVRYRFNVSIAEVESNNFHKSIVIAIACVSNSAKHSNSCIQKVINFIEENTEAIVENIELEIL